MYLKILLLLQLVCLSVTMGPNTRMRTGRIVVLEVNREEVKLQCLKQNLQPLNDAQWTKDGVAVEDSADERIIISDSILTIKPVYPHDEGVYQCNDGDELELQVPSRMIGEENAVLMQELGSTFNVPCGIELGPISRSKEYSIRWQRLSDRDRHVIIISSCVQNSEQNTEEGIQSYCSEDYNSEDFTITIHNFTVSSFEVDEGEREVIFRCLVEQLTRPSSYSLPITDVDAIVSFQYEPAAVSKPLFPYTIIQNGSSEELVITFLGYPLNPSGIDWQLNNNIQLLNSNHSETKNVSSLVLSSDRVESGDIVTATVNVFNGLSLSSTTTTIIVLSAIEDFTLTRPSGCSSAPVLKLNITNPIPVPYDKVILHIEFTRIVSSGTEESDKVFNEMQDAGVLTETNHMMLDMEDIPYMLLMSMSHYVIRVKLEVLDAVSQQWSHYSHPLCIICEDCLNPPSMDIYLQLYFPENSYACQNMELDDTFEALLVEELIEKIQESCEPQYLCIDLTLSHVNITCSDSDGTILTALASGVSSGPSIEAFLESISENGTILYVNGISIEIKSLDMNDDNTVMTTSSSDASVTKIAATSGGSLLTVAMIVTLLLVIFTVWRHWRRHRNSESSTGEGSQEQVGTASDDVQVTTQSTLEQETPHHLDLGLPPHHTHDDLSTPSAILLTVSQAGDLVENYSDDCSPDYISTTQSDIVSRGSIPFHSYSHIPFSNQTHKLPSTQVLPVRSRESMALPLSPFHTGSSSIRATPVPSCSCSCHSWESTRARSTSPSTTSSWLLSSPTPSRPMMSSLALRYKQAISRSSSSASSASVGHTIEHSQHYYRQWTNRNPPQPHRHVTQPNCHVTYHKQTSTLESPV